MRNDFTFSDFLFFNDNDTAEWEMQVYDSIASKTSHTLSEFTATGRLQKILVSEPGSNIIGNILSYSRALSVIKTEKSGIFHLILN